MVIVFKISPSLRSQGDLKENITRGNLLRVEMIEDMFINAIRREPWEWDGFQKILGQNGTGILMCAETEKEEFVETLIHECRNNASAFVDPKGGMGAIVFLYSERRLILKDLADIAEVLTHELHPHALVLYGWHETAGMGERVRVMCLITGIPESQCSMEETTDRKRPGRMPPVPSELIENIE